MLFLHSAKEYPPTIHQSQREDPINQFDPESVRRYYDVAKHSSRNLENKEFSIHLERFDSQFVKKLDRCDHPNVFYRTDTHKEYPFVITSLQFARMERNRELLSTLYWDIVIVDEAHHLRRYIQNSGNYRETLGYTLARKLGEKARSLLLLTATPIQLH